LSGWLAHIDRFFNRLAIAFLVFNLCIVSIPRCDSVFAYLKHRLTEPRHSDAFDNCRPRSLESDREDAISSPSICSCSVLQFVFFTSPVINFEESVLFKPQLLKLILFLEPRRLLSRIIVPEPPYPKRIS